MVKLLISYDLKNPGRNYPAVHRYFEQFDYFKPLESVYVIKTSKTASKVRDDLTGIIDANDKTLVVDITDSDWATRHIPGFKEWMSS